MGNGQPTKKQIKDCFDDIIGTYGNKSDNFIVQVMCDKLEYRDKDYIKEVLAELADKGEL